MSFILFRKQQSVSNTPATIYPAGFPATFPQVEPDAQPDQTAHFYYHGAAVPVKTLLGNPMTAHMAWDKLRPIVEHMIPHLLPEYGWAIDDHNYVVLVTKP